MVSLEDLTKEELIWLLRDKVPEIEEPINLQVALSDQSKKLFAKACEFSALEREVNDKQLALCAPYRKNNEKRFYVPNEVQKQLMELDKEKKNYSAGWRKYFDAYTRAFDLSMELFEERVLDIKAIKDNLVEI